MSRNSLFKAAGEGLHQESKSSRKGGRRHTGERRKADIDHVSGPVTHWVSNHLFTLKGGLRKPLLTVDTAVSKKEKHNGIK